MEFSRDTHEKIIENLHDGLYCVDRNRTVTYWNRAAEKITGYSAQEVIGKSCADNILTHVDGDGNSLCHTICPLAATIADGQRRTAELYLHHKDGHRIPVAVRSSVLTDDEGNVIGGFELFTDISNQAANRIRLMELERIALLDSLTELPNRHYLEKELQCKIEEQKRLGVDFGVLFMDVDHFKTFNDTFGHNAGDMVLRCVAKTFTTNSRPFDLYGRWGGEEFLGIVRTITHDGLEQLGNRMRMLVESSYILYGVNKLCVTVSVGASMFRDGDTIESLIKRADDLLYRSKKAGRNRLSIG